MDWGYVWLVVGVKRTISGSQHQTRLPILVEAVTDFRGSGECDGTYSYVYTLPYLVSLNTLAS